MVDVSGDGAPSRSPVVVGAVFGRWSVTGFVSRSAHGEDRWACRCECGNEKSVLGQSLRCGDSRSCGCLMVERVKNAVTKHGASAGGKISREYAAWANAIERCENESYRHFANYGGRGITVCAEWRHDFPAFLAHIGPRPSKTHSLDRIDNDRGYEPGNVRWATKKEQGRNRRSNRLIAVGGVVKTVAEWSADTGLPHACLLQRINRGWSPEDAVSTPSGVLRIGAAPTSRKKESVT